MNENKKFFLAKYGSKEHQDQIIKDDNYENRAEVARYTTHKEHMDQLVNDENIEVKSALIDNHNLTKNHLKYMMNDPYLGDEAEEMLHYRFPSKKK